MHLAGGRGASHVRAGRVARRHQAVHEVDRQKRAIRRNWVTKFRRVRQWGARAGPSRRARRPEAPGDRGRYPAIPAGRSGQSGLGSPFAFSTTARAGCPASRASTWSSRVALPKRPQRLVAAARRVARPPARTRMTGSGSLVIAQPRPAVRRVDRHRRHRTPGARRRTTRRNGGPYAGRINVNPALARQVDAGRGEARPADQDGDLHLHRLDHHLRREPPRRVERLARREMAWRCM